MFIDEYLNNGLNGTEAYKAVYQNVSDKVAGVNANRLLGNADILAEIQAKMAQTANKFKITREDLIRDLARIKDQNIDVAPPFALKAIELIAKMLGFNEPDKLDITSQGKQIQINLNLLDNSNNIIITDHGQANQNVLANPDETLQIGQSTEQLNISQSPDQPTQTFSSQSESLDDIGQSIPNPDE